MRELWMWSKTKHVNVQELSGIILFQGQLGMVSPWMDHGNLQEYLRKHLDVDRYQLVGVHLDGHFNSAYTYVRVVYPSSHRRSLSS